LPDSRAASMSIIFSAPFFVVIVIIALFIILQLSLAFCHILYQEQGKGCGRRQGKAEG
jgi:hypothetical protein